METDTRVYDELIEKELPPQMVPPEITKGEAQTIIPADVKNVAPCFATTKLSFQPGMSLMQELPTLLLRSDEPFEDQGQAATAHCLQYEMLVKILEQMDDRFFRLQGVAF